MSDLTREDAIRELKVTYLGDTDKMRQAKDCAISALSTDVSPNIHGHWKVGFGNTWCSCSECSGNGSTNWSYCPWCGADMRGKAE